MNACHAVINTCTMEEPLQPPVKKAKKVAAMTKAKLRDFKAMLRKFSQSADACDETLAFLGTALAEIRLRVVRAGARLAADTDLLLDAIVRFQKEELVAARAGLHNFTEKLVIEHIEEAEASARLLDAICALSVQSRRAKQLLNVLPLSVSEFYDTFFISSRSSNVGVPTVAVPDIIGILSRNCLVWCDSVDAVASDVSGAGLFGFLQESVARNHIRIVPRTSGGALAEYVVAEDVQVGTTLTL